MAVLYSCDPVDDKLIITNQSDQKVYYMLSPTELSIFYKKTMDEQHVSLTYQGAVDYIESKRSRHETMMGRRGKAWENYVKFSCDGGKLRIYTFSLDTLTKYNFKSIVDHNRYLTKKEYSFDDLNKLSWEVVFR